MYFCRVKVKQPYLLTALLALVLLLPVSECFAADERTQQLIDRFLQQYARMEVDSALATLDEQILLQQELGNEALEGNARWNKIAILNNSARYEELAQIVDSAMNWFLERELWSRFYQCWQRKCSANHSMGRLQTALREAKAMAEDARQRDNRTGRAMASKQMALIYSDMQQLDQAEEAYSRSVELLKEEGDTTGILSGVYEGLCEVLSRQKKYDEEMRINKEWETHLDSLVTKQGIGFVSQTYVACYLTYCENYIGLNRLGDAQRALDKAIEYQAIAKTALAQNDIYMAHCRLALARGRAKEALAFSDSALSLGIDAVDTHGKELRAEALLMVGQGAEAARLYRELYQEKDSIFTRDLRTQLDELNTLFRVDELEREQQQLELEQQRLLHHQQQSTMMYSAVILLLIVAALIVFNLLSRRSARRLAEKNRELADKNAALLVATEKAQVLERMKTEFIRNMSHEIRTPLNILNGFTQILTSAEADALGSDEKDDIRQRIEENTTRITGLVNKMLEISDSNSQTVIDRLDRITVGEWVHMAVTTAGVANTPQVELRVSLDDEAAQISLQTNSSQAVRALVQLVDNAFKFTREGSVTITASVTAAAVTVAVEDTGIGIPPEEAQHVFERFVQLDDYYDGTGIGLPMAQTIARRLGGDIILDTAYTLGARFLMSLPR